MLASSLHHQSSTLTSALYRCGLASTLECLRQGMGPSSVDLSSALIPTKKQHFSTFGIALGDMLAPFTPSTNSSENPVTEAATEIESLLSVLSGNDRTNTLSN